MTRGEWIDDKLVSDATGKPLLCCTPGCLAQARKAFYVDVFGGPATTKAGGKLYRFHFCCVEHQAVAAIEGKRGISPKLWREVEPLT